MSLRAEIFRELFGKGTPPYSGGPVLAIGHYRGQTFNTHIHGDITLIQKVMSGVVHTQSPNLSILSEYVNDYEAAQD